MTVSSLVPVNNYTGNGSATEFDFDFLIENQAELVVTHTDKNGFSTVLQFGIDYSIKEIGNENGSYIVFPLASSEFCILANDEVISLSLDLPIKQESEFANSAYLNLNVLEKTFDYITRILQILNRKIERSIKVKEGSAVSSDSLMKELKDAEKNASLYSVACEEYTKKAKAYSDNSSLKADEAQNSANLASETVANALSDIENAKNSAINCVDDTIEIHTSEASSALDLTKEKAINSINNEEVSSINLVKAEGATQKNSLQGYVNTASNHATNSKNSQELAKKWAVSDSIVENGLRSAKYYAQHAQGLSDVTYEHLRASRAYEDKGAVLSDEEGFATIQKYKHSTFDLSKFTVVGSPTISDDGIVSGFSSNNYLMLDVSVVSKLLVGDFKFHFKFKTMETVSGALILGGGDELGGTFSLWISNSQVAPIIYLDNTGTVQRSPLGNIENANILANTEYECYFSKKGNNYGFGIKKVGDSNYITSKGFDSSYSICANTQLICKSNGKFSIPLGSMAIISNGYPVFNGNKNGLDIIKPDNYEIVGSPTITSDGVASGFSANNYIKLPENLLSNALTWKFEFEYTPDSNSNYAGTILQSINTTTYSGLVVQGRTAAINFFLGSGVGSHDIANNINVSIERGTNKIEVGYDGSEYFCIVNGVKKWGLQSELKVNFPSSAGVGYHSWWGALTNGSLALNSLKIYANGNLNYQACLKIPYTESDSGLKIVDAVYRDRVQDVYEQYGQAKYFTLDEENKNFTLPMGNLYSMMSNETLSDDFANKDLSNLSEIGQMLFDNKANLDLSNCTQPYVVESLIDSGFGYRVWSNGFLEEWGELSAVTDANYNIVTFLKGFKSTSYSVFVTLQEDFKGALLSYSPLVRKVNAASMSIFSVDENTKKYGKNWYAFGKGA